MPGWPYQFHRWQFRYFAKTHSTDASQRNRRLLLPRQPDGGFCSQQRFDSEYTETQNYCDSGGKRLVLCPGPRKKEHATTRTKGQGLAVAVASGTEFSNGA